MLRLVLTTAAALLLTACGRGGDIGVSMGSPGRPDVAWADTGSASGSCFDLPSHQFSGQPSTVLESLQGERTATGHLADGSPLEVTSLIGLPLEASWWVWEEREGACWEGLAVDADPVILRFGEGSAQTGEDVKVVTVGGAALLRLDITVAENIIGGDPGRTLALSLSRTASTERGTLTDASGAVAFRW